MSGNKKKASGSSFSFFGMFKSKNSRTRRVEYEANDDCMKAYKVWRSDEDRGRWVAKPNIDQIADEYILSITRKYEKSVEVAN